jgi:hypothetical protein
VAEAKQPSVWVYAPVARDDIDAFTRTAGITPDGLLDSTECRFARDRKTPALAERCRATG